MENSKLFSFFFFVFLLFTVNLYSQNKLLISTDFSDKTTFDLKEIKKIVFTSEKFLIINDSEEQEYPLSDTKYLSFDVAPTYLAPDKMREKVNVFPNPVTDEISVESEELILKLVLYDLNGKVVRQSLAMTSASKLEVSGLPSGNYILQVVTPESSVIKKIIKK